MSTHEYTAAEAVQAAIASARRRQGLVRISPKGEVDVQTGRGWVYQFEVRDAGDGLRWIEHLAAKTWFTPCHALALAARLADHFGARYR